MLSKYSDKYSDLHLYFNKSEADSNGYNADTNFKPDLCKAGTRGTILEDQYLLTDGMGLWKWNALTFKNHYWVGYWTNHDPWWYASNAVDYAETIFRRGVETFGDGDEEKALFYLGRCVHLMEDMGAVAHVYGDSHPGILAAFTSTDHSGYEDWCSRNRGQLHGSERIVSMSSLRDGMERLADETFRSARISGHLRRDYQEPVTGDLAEMFPSQSYLRYIPTSIYEGLEECWYIDGLGYSVTGDGDGRPDFTLPVWDSVELSPALITNDWWRIPNLPNEGGEYYYIESRQDTIVPARIYATTGGAEGWVDNTSGYTLAQLWAGVDGYRATPEQQAELIPRAIEFAAGALQYIWDFINPPPHVTLVEVRQAPDGTDICFDDESQIVYQKGWREIADGDNKKSKAREFYGIARTASHQPATITVTFSEPVRNVRITLGKDVPQKEICREQSSWRGPPTAEEPDGPNILVLSDVDLSTLPAGKITLFINADDLSNHVGEDCSHLDPDPGTRAARKPNGEWARYPDEGGDAPDTDRNHSFEIGTFLVRLTPSGSGLKPGESVSHAVQIRNLGVPLGLDATLAVTASAPGWTVAAEDVDGLHFQMPETGADWTTVAPEILVTNNSGGQGKILVKVGASNGGEEQFAAAQDWAVADPLNDHPDDTESVADPRYPTSWLIDTDAPVGILMNGWGAGLGHLLGRYGIATALVDEDLAILNKSGADVRALRVLLVGSGGLAGLDAVASFREKIAAYVAGGGALIVSTPKLGKELAALPGGAVAGYGWTEDQACFGEAVSIAARHVALSGQDRLRLDAGADGYLTRWPDEAEILLRRTSNEQPAMIRYPYGEGEVFVLTLYPDWSYGGAQSTGAERNLVRDLVTYALARPAAVPEFLPGDAVALAPTIANRGLQASARAVLETQTPDRAGLATDRYDLPLAAGASASVALGLTAPDALGIYPVTFALEDAAGAVVQGPSAAANFAVRADLDIPAAAAEGYRIWVTVPSDTVPIGSTVGSTVHVANTTAQEFHGYLAATWVHLGEGAVVIVPEVVVPAYGEEAFALAYPLPDEYSATVLYILNAGAPPADVDFRSPSLASAYKGFTAFFPFVSLAIVSAAERIIPDTALPFTVQLRNSGSGALTLDLRATLHDPDNQELWTEQRRVVLAGSGLLEESFTLSVSAAAGGLYPLEVEVLSGGTLVGQGAKSFLRASPRLSVTPQWPHPWIAGAENSAAFSLENIGELRIAGESFTLSVSAAGGETLWSGTTALPSLEAGERADLTVPIVMPALPFGEGVIRYEALFAGGNVTVERPLVNRVAVEIGAPERICRAGETFSGEVTLRNQGDLTGPAVLEIGIPGFGWSRTVPLDDLATRNVSFSTPVPADVAPGTYEITAAVRMVDSATATLPFSIPPPRLDYLPAPEEVSSGEILTLTVVNTGGARGDFDWDLRLLSCAGDPEDPDAPRLASGQGRISLAPGEDGSFTLAIPADIPRGLYTLVSAAVDRSSGATDSRNFFVFVEGVSIALEAATARPHYFAGEDVTVATRVVNGGPSLSGASLRLQVAGSGGVDPVYFEGTVYVSPAGDDLTGDGSRDRPLATIQAGIDAAPAGARVLLLSGAYAPGEVLLRAGTILQGEVVAGEPAAAIAGADLIGVSGVTLDHLRLEDSLVVFPAAASGVRVSECSFQDLSRTRIFGQGIVFAGSAANVFIARNRFSRLLHSEAGVQFRGAAEEIDVVENTFSDLPAGDGGVHFWNGAKTVLVQGNTLSGLHGGCSGIHLWETGTDTAHRGIRILNNRLAEMSGNCDGIWLWETGESVEIRGNEIADLAGASDGISCGGTLRDAIIADNTLSRLQGDASGILLWGDSRNPFLDVEVSNNLLEEITPLDDRSAVNGIHVWENARHLLITGNLVRAVTDSYPADLESGIGLWDTAELVEVSRNIVRDSTAGITLRPPAGAARSTYRLDAVIAHNLLIGNGVGILEETSTSGGAAVLRDNIILDSSRAAVLYRNTAGIPASSPLSHNDLFGNAAACEGRAAPAAGDGNLAADPLFADAAGGDFHLLSASPCRDVSSEAPLDIGPYEDTQEIHLGPQIVADATLATVHWTAAAGLDLAADAVDERTTAVTPLAAAGRLRLTARVQTAAGLTLAERTAAFTVHAEEVTLTLASPRTVYRHGETIPLQGEVGNRGTTALSDLLVRLTRDGEPICELLLDLAPEESVSFACETAAAASTIVHGAAGLASVELPIQIAAPDVELQVRAPAVVNEEPFALAALLRNQGLVPVDLDLDLAGERHLVTLDAGAEKAFTKTCRITADTVFLVTVTGDVKDSMARTVRYGVRPAVALRVQHEYPSGPVTVGVTLTNEGELGGGCTATVSLSTGGGSPAGAWTLPVWVEAGGSLSQQLALGDLAPGSYRLAAATGAQSTEAVFAVLDPLDVSISGMAIATALDSDGTLPVIVRVRNGGAEAVAGTLDLETGIGSFSRSVQIAAGGEREETFRLPVSGCAPGSYPVVATMMRGGEIVAMREDRLALFPQLALSAVPADQTMDLGGTAVVPIGVSNGGPVRGLFSLRLAGGDLIDETQVAFVDAAAATALSFSFAVPDDLPSLAYPASVTLTDLESGATEQRDFILRPANPVHVETTTAFDREAYRQGDTAAMTLTVRNFSNSTAALRVAVSHGDFREWREIVVTPRPELLALDVSTVPGELQLRPGAREGSFTSSVLEVGDAQGAVVSWSATTPAGCATTAAMRTGGIANPDDGWSLWEPVMNGEPAAAASGRFLQYRILISCAQPFPTPSISEVAIECTASGRRFIHTSQEDFIEMPVRLDYAFTVDFTGDDRVFTGVYTTSGRSVRLDAVVIRQAGEEVTLWTDRDRYDQGDRVTVFAEAAAAGVIEVESPAGHALVVLPGPGTTSFFFDLPAEMVSGTYYLQAIFLGRTTTIPIEVAGYAVRVVEAALNRAAYLPGEEAILELEIFSADDIADITVEGQVSRGGSASRAFLETRDLWSGTNRLVFRFPIAGTASGLAECSFALTKNTGGAESLYLAGGRVFFDLLSPNLPPVAAAGPDLDAAERSWVTLDGGGSSDPDGDALSFRWTQTSGPPVVLYGDDAPQPVFIAPEVGRAGADLGFALIVSDGRAQSAADQLAVHVADCNRAPLARAGADITRKVGESAALDGSLSYDPDGDALAFSWAMTLRPAGSAAALDDDGALRPAFTVDRNGEYAVSLTVSDGQAESAPDTVNISTVNSPPVAVAGDDQTARLGDIVHLDGGASFDPDDDELTYRWRLLERPEGSAAALQDAAAAAASFTVDLCGDYLIELVVEDGILAGEPDTVRVSCRNSRPTADAGPDQAVRLGQEVLLDGTGSADPDGDLFGYRWFFSKLPEESHAVLADPASPHPSFVPDLVGTYGLTLIVDDGELESEPDAVVIEAGAAIAAAEIFLKPSVMRRSSPPSVIQAWIELPDGWSAEEIDPSRAVILAVGRKTLPRPVACTSIAEAGLTDRDADGLPELRLIYPLKSWRKFLVPGKNLLTIQGPLETYGSFLGIAELRVLR